MDDINKDMEIVQDVLSGNKEACEQFVEKYTDWVLYKVWNLMKSHCKYPATEYVCCLLLLEKQRKGKQSLKDDRIHCDECIDSYIWIFEYLKKKIKAYKGINNCRLNTYVWSIINSHTTYIDWLRWKYGRVF